MRLTKLRAAAAAAVFSLTGALVAAQPAEAVDIDVVTTPSGLTVWLVEEPSIPIVSVSLSFRGGAAHDPAGQEGLARLFASLLDEGAGPYDEAAFARKVDEVAARFSFTGGRDSLAVSATMLADRLDESLELLRLAITEPRFDAAPVERVKAQAISRIRQSQTEPNAIAARRWFADAFPGDRYGAPTGGREETVAAIGPDELRAAASALLNRENVFIGVVGAISAEEVGPAIDRLLSGIAESGPASQPPAPFSGAAGVEVVSFDAPQSTVIFGQPGLARSDPDFIPAFVMNYVLGGGGFESRLMTEIREKEGLAYGVGSYLSPLDRAPLYLGSVATENASVARSIELVKREWARMAEIGLSEDELARAKTYLTGAFPLRFDSNAKIAAFLVSAQVDELGVDYIDRRNDLVDAVTVEDIQRVAARVLDPEALFFVVVGEPEGL